MTIKDYKPDAVEGDRFDAEDSDVSQQPDLEDDPGHPDDILPDQVKRFAGTEEEEDEEAERRITARPREEARPILAHELPEG
jgi:hypothetical protein